MTFLYSLFYYVYTTFYIKVFNNSRDIANRTMNLTVPYKMTTQSHSKNKSDNLSSHSCIQSSHIFGSGEAWRLCSLFDQDRLINYSSLSKFLLLALLLLSTCLKLLKYEWPWPKVKDDIHHWYLKNIDCKHQVLHQTLQSLHRKPSVLALSNTCTKAPKGKFDTTVVKWSVSSNSSFN